MQCLEGVILRTDSHGTRPTSLETRHALIDRHSTHGSTVKHAQLACLSVDHLYKSESAESFVELVVNEHGVNRVTCGECSKHFVPLARVQEVADDDHNGFAPLCLGQEAQAFSQVGLTTRSGGVVRVSDDVPHMTTAGTWRNEVLHTVGEGQQSDTVSVANACVGQARGDSRTLKAFISPTIPSAGTHVGRPRDIYGENDGELAFFAEHLDEGLTRTCRDVPVNVPDIVSRDILADFLKLHASTAKCTAPITGKQGIDLATGVDMEAANLTQFFWR